MPEEQKSEKLKHRTSNVRRSALNVQAQLRTSGTWWRRLLMKQC